MKFNKKGFTLIELMVVIAIIGLLSTIILASLSNTRAKAKNVAIKGEVVQILNALQLYRADVGKGFYPSNSGNCFSTAGAVAVSPTCCLGGGGPAYTSCTYADGNISPDFYSLSPYLKTPRAAVDTFVIAGNNYRGYFYVCDVREAGGPQRCLDGYIIYPQKNISTNECLGSYSITDSSNKNTLCYIRFSK